MVGWCCSNDAHHVLAFLCRQGMVPIVVVGFVCLALVVGVVTGLMRGVFGGE